MEEVAAAGALQVVDGLVALPADAETVEAFDWLADEVIDAGGSAWTWPAQAGSKQQHAELVAQASAAVADQYRDLVEQSRSVGAGASRRTVDRLRRHLRAIRGRDRFGVRGAEEARRAVERVAAAATTEAGPG